MDCPFTMIEVLRIIAIFGCILGIAAAVYLLVTTPKFEEAERWG